jgi:hypothetical protein
MGCIDCYWLHSVGGELFPLLYWRDFSMVKSCLTVSLIQSSKEMSRSQKRLFSDFRTTGADTSRLTLDVQLLLAVGRVQPEHLVLDTLSGVSGGDTLLELREVLVNTIDDLLVTEVLLKEKVGGQCLI